MYDVGMYKYIRFIYPWPHYPNYYQTIMKFPLGNTYTKISSLNLLNKMHLHVIASLTVPQRCIVWPWHRSQLLMLALRIYLLYLNTHCWDLYHICRTWGIDIAYSIIYCKCVLHIVHILVYKYIIKILQPIRLKSVWDNSRWNNLKVMWLDSPRGATHNTSLQSLCDIIQ